MFVDTEITEMPNRDGVRPSPESLLKMVTDRERAKLRVYVGAAAGVGKTYQMLDDAHQLREQGIDVVIGVVETHGRAETEEQIKDLEIVPPQKIEYRGSTFERDGPAGDHRPPPGSGGRR